MPPSDSKLISDSELMTRARGGDADGFRMLVDRHKDPVVSYLHRLTACRPRAEELAQESFVRLFLSPPDLGHAASNGASNGASAKANGASVLPWLYRVATNLVHTEERRARRTRFYGWLLGRGAQAAEDQEGRLLAQEAQQQTQRALAELPLAFRAALVLREIQGLSYEEIATAVGCPVGTVRSRINRGRALLRERLAPYWNGEEPSPTTAPPLPKTEEA